MTSVFLIGGVSPRGPHRDKHIHTYDNAYNIIHIFVHAEYDNNIINATGTNTKGTSPQGHFCASSIERAAGARRAEAAWERLHAGRKGRT